MKIPSTHFPLSENATLQRRGIFWLRYLNQPRELLKNLIIPVSQLVCAGCEEARLDSRQR